MEWSTKCYSDPPLAILHAFYKERLSIALQRVEATSIFRHVVIVGEGSFGLSVLSGFPSPFYYYYYYYYMLLVISRAFETWFVLMALCDPLWVLLFWFKLRSSLSLFLVSPPLAGCSMEFARVSKTKHMCWTFLKMCVGVGVRGGTFCTLSPLWHMQSQTLN